MAYEFLKDKEDLYFIPLGGSEQFGVNLNVYAYKGKLIAIDCGIGFADDSVPGIDILLPDPVFLEDHQKDLKALIITHAHEDHIGAVAHLWPRLKCPIYTSAFSAEVLKKKFDEAGIKDAVIKVITPGNTLSLKPFTLDFISVAHSIPEAFSVVVQTEKGQVLHSGDWNLDPSPVLGTKTDEKSFKAIGKKGVMAYIGDSTNAASPGMSGSEADVERGLTKVFRGCRGRIAITMFSSNIGRIQSICRAAEATGRHVGVIGRSLHRMIGCARNSGYLNNIPDFVSEEELGYLPDDKAVMILTGSQGEYRAALAKLARGDHNAISIKQNDTVIFSARSIPGNEKDINAVKNNLSAANVNVITPYECKQTIHVSGHPCQEEIAQMLQWVRPTCVIPVHGERYQLDAHAEFSKKCQIKQVVVPNNGSVIKITPKGSEIVDHVPTGLLALDQKRIISIDHRSIAERRKLQYTGAIHISLALDARGKIKGEPQMDTQGLFDLDEPKENRMEQMLYNEIYDLLDEMSVEEKTDDHFIEEEIRIGLRRLSYHLLGIKPKTTVHLIRV